MGVSGRRYYSPSQGRFLGRDPKKEKGGLNLYGFCGNNSINRWDILGMVSPEVLQAELELLRDELQRISEDQTTGYLERSQYQPRIDEINAQIERLEEQLGRLAQGADVFNPSLPPFGPPGSPTDSLVNWAVTPVVAPPARPEPPAALRVAYVIRISPFDTGQTDTNAKHYASAIDDLNGHFRDNNIIREKRQLQFATANVPNDLNDILRYAEKEKALIVFVLHGNTANNDAKNAFGRMMSPPEMISSWNKSANSEYLSLQTSRFISCDEDVGARPPSWQTENRILPILREYYGGQI